MPRVVLLLILTFVESLATILVERAAYFFCRERLGFSDTQNLALALVFGAAYAVGAVVSHRVAVSAGEKKALLGTLAAQLVVHVVMGLHPTAWMLFAGSAVTGFLAGHKWPIIESYVSAGRSPVRTARVIGWFNLAWASAVPVSLAVAGPLIAWRSWALFLLGAAINAASLLMIATLPPRPSHLAHDHPDRPTAPRLRRWGHLLGAARWLLLAGYSTMWILAALMPGIFDRLGYSTRLASGMSSVLDLARLTVFAALGAWAGWHGRRVAILAGMALMPVGFVMVLAGEPLAVVLVGEAVFGTGIGMVYFASLYYAMVVKNASVAAGGGHEGLIGAGFAVGPAAGLLGVALEGSLGSTLYGICATAGVVVVTCSALAALHLLRAGASETEDDPETGS